MRGALAGRNDGIGGFAAKKKGGTGVLGWRLVVGRCK